MATVTPRRRLVHTPEGPDYEPEDGPLHSDSPCDCPDGACGCYGEGYAAGKDKAHFEVRALAEGPPHGSGCGCDPGRTIGAVLAAWRGRCEGGT